MGRLDSKMQPFVLETINDTLTCHIYPRSKFPNGLYLTYDNCPEIYDNQTAKLIRYCCLSIMISLIQDSLYKKTQDWLRYNSSTILVGPAVFFNILSLIVLTRFQRIRSMSQNSTAFYMKCLCIFDTLTIVNKFLYEIIVVRNGSREEPLVISSFMCKFLSFSESCCAISSIYILIAMSFEKLVCVVIPLKVSLILTRFKAKIIFASILIVSSLISSYNLLDKRVFIFESYEELENSYSYNSSTNIHSIVYKANNNSNTKTIHKRISYDCDSNWPEKKNDWILINNIIRVFLPILFLCICNSWIIIALSKANKSTEAMFMRRPSNSQMKRSASDKISKKKLKQSNSERTFRFKSFQKPKLSVPTINYSESTVNDFQVPFSPNKTKINGIFKKSNNYLNKHQSKTKNNTQNISIMLVTVSIGFVICNLPFAIRTLFQRQFSEKFKILDYLYQEDNLFITTTSKTEISNAVKYEFFSSLTHLLLDLNYILNFFLYFLSGSRFRSQLFLMLKCDKSIENPKIFINTAYNFKDADKNFFTEKNRKCSTASMNYAYVKNSTKNFNQSYSFDTLRFNNNTRQVLFKTTETSLLKNSNKRSNNFLS